MKTKALSWLGCGVILATVVLTPILALAQSDEMPSAGMSMAVGAVILICALAAYVYVALAVQTIANKTNTPNSWLAWIPIANIILLLNVAQKPVWWIVLFLIPLVSLIMAIIVWMAVAERRGKPSWWGIMLIVPVMNVIMPGYLAWSD
jgi:hypothetical protein